MAIAELLARELSAERWGWKAARLSEAARHHLPVPQAICLDMAQLSDRREQSRGVVARWLNERRLRTVVIRSSATAEDGDESSGAGRFMTARDLPARADAVMEAVDTVIASMVRCAVTAGSVIVQHQVEAELSGVTFTLPDGVLVTEASSRPTAVTDGDPPDFRLVSRPDSYRVVGDLTIVPSAVLSSQLRNLAAGLGEVFPFRLDVEWASVAGQLYLLQVRPVTASLTEVRG